jgi:hypothetical protein
MVSCDRDFNAVHPLGNVAGGVMRIWNGSKMRELRQRHTRQRFDALPVCSRCVEWSWWRPTPLSGRGNLPKQ